MSTPYYQDDSVTLYHGDALDVARTLPDGAANCIVTSPPYFGLRDYGTEGQYGLEASPVEYVERMRGLFSELHRVLADDGTLWLNIGDSYSQPAASAHGEATKASSTLGGRKAQDRITTPIPRRALSMPAKNLLGIPWRVAFALQDDGWILRNAIIWNKPNAMPESVTDRLSNRYEHVFMFSKNRRYYYSLNEIREPRVVPDPSGRMGRLEKCGPSTERHRGGKAQSVFTTGAYKTDGKNPGDVWEIATVPFSQAHFAVYPVALPQRCILAGCKPGGTVLDPFNGSGTTGLAAQKTGRKYIGIDLNAEYLDLSLRTRLHDAVLDFGDPA